VSFADAIAARSAAVDKAELKLTPASVERDTDGPAEVVAKV
jgi:hypothetical protein